MCSSDLDPAAELNASNDPSLNFSAGSVRFGVGKEGVLLVTLMDDAIDTLGDIVRVKLNARFLCRSMYRTPNEGSMAVWSGFVVGPVRLLKLNRTKK